MVDIPLSILIDVLKKICLIFGIVSFFVYIYYLENRKVRTTDEHFLMNFKYASALYMRRALVDKFIKEKCIITCIT